jgi:hypothetical protein
MAGLLRDDSGQISGQMGLAMLIASMVFATILTGVLYILFTPAIYTMVTTVNAWIGMGWVSKQGHDMIAAMMLIWVASAAVIYVVILVGTIIRSIVLKGIRGY